MNKQRRSEREILALKPRIVAWMRNNASAGSTGSTQPDPATLFVPLRRRVDTTWPLLDGGELSGDLNLQLDPVVWARPYATKVIAAVDSVATDVIAADYICDGVDDQEQFQLAVDALSALGGAILLLEGNFVVGGTTTISSYITFSGADTGTYITYSDEAATTFDMFSLDGWGIILRNLYIDGNVGVLAEGEIAHIIAANSVSHFAILNNCLYSAQTDAIYLVEPATGAIEGNRIYTPSRHGIHLWSPTNCRVHGNFISGCGHSGIAIGGTP